MKFPKTCVLSFLQNFWHEILENESLLRKRRRTRTSDTRPAFLHQFKIEHETAILTASKFAQDKRVVGDIENHRS